MSWQRVLLLALPQEGWVKLSISVWPFALREKVPESSYATALEAPRSTRHFKLGWLGAFTFSLEVPLQPFLAHLEIILVELLREWPPLNPCSIRSGE